MHRFIYWSALLGLAMFGPSAMARETLRVMTFNVRTLAAQDGANGWEHRRDLMARTIAEQQPDVLGTQELFKQQGDYLASKLPRYAWFGIGRYGNDGDEHMGVFYRADKLSVVQSGNFWLSDTPNVPGSITWGHPLPRMVTWALFEDKAMHRRFYYYNTHFPYRDQDEEARSQAAREIVERIKALPRDVPVVLTGDFNSTPDKPDHALLASVLDDARDKAPTQSGPLETFHNFTGHADKRIDWIFFRGFSADSVSTVTTSANGRYPSDHFPVFALLEWPTQP